MFDYTISVNYQKVGLSVEATPFFRGFLINSTDQLRPAVIILPGGGYQNLSAHEGEPIARRFNELGCHAFVLSYSCSNIAGMRFPGALLEVLETIRIVRQNSIRWSVDPNRIVVCGFSAGGHLAGCAGTMWNRDFIKKCFGQTISVKPNGMVLCYPVISYKKMFGGACASSVSHLLKENFDNLREQVSLEKQVDKDTVPVFLWHTYEDKGVHVQNAFLFAEALYGHRIPLEMHIFPYGGHGLGLGELQPECVCWTEMAARWIENI